MVFKVENNIFPSNTYLIKDDNSSDSVIIDPGLDYQNIDNVIINNSLNPIAILCTHGHFDHIASVSFFKQKYNGIPFFIHQLDYKLIKSANFFLKITRIKYWIDYVEPDFFYNENEVLKINQFHFKIARFPGHSQGSCVIHYQNSVFSGDILYKKGLGFNNFPGEDKIALKKSIKYIIENYDKSLMFYPGHGGVDTLSNILASNLELINFIES